MYFEVTSVLRINTTSKQQELRHNRTIMNIYTSNLGQWFHFRISKTLTVQDWFGLESVSLHLLKLIRHNRIRFNIYVLCLTQTVSLDFTKLPKQVRNNRTWRLLRLYGLTLRETNTRDNEMYCGIPLSQQ